MLSELYELLLGLVGAAIGLAAIYFFAAHSMRESEHAKDDASTGGVTSNDTPKAGVHDALLALDELDLVKPAPDISFAGPPKVIQIYTSPEAGAPMLRKSEIIAEANSGLVGDRYSLNKGHWSESDECEVTLIAQEYLEAISAETGMDVSCGRHRRNLVTQGIDLNSLIGRRFQIGEAWFSSARQRPPCLYLQKLTEPGMARALVGRGGIGVHCFKSGAIRENDGIVILDLSIPNLLRRRLQSMFSRATGPV